MIQKPLLLYGITLMYAGVLGVNENTLEIKQRGSRQAFCADNNLRRWATH